MKIERAIELLCFIKGDLRNGPHKERVCAVELGIEALKFVQRAKRAKPRPFPEGVIRLPGETEEE